MSTIISLLKLMRVILVIYKWLKMAHFTLNDSKKDLPMLILPFFTFPFWCILKHDVSRVNFGT